MTFTSSPVWSDEPVRQRRTDGRDVYPAVAVAVATHYEKPGESVGDRGKWVPVRPALSEELGLQRGSHLKLGPGLRDPGSAQVIADHPTTAEDPDDTGSSSG